MPTATRLTSPFVLALAAAFVFAGQAPADPAQIDSKRAQAERVLAEIRAMDMELEHAIEAWNGANVRLEEIEGRLAANQKRLRVARTSLKTAQATAEARLVALYTSSEPDTIELILGATSLSDLVDRIDTSSRVAADDARIAEEVRTFRDEVRQRQQALGRAQAEQEQVVARRAAERRTIEAQLGERQALYDSVRAEIAVLEEEERQRQERLAAQARRDAAAAAREERRPSAASPAAQPATPSPAPPSAGSGGRQDVVSIALRYLGIPYRWGGSSPSTGFDCSGFTMFVYRQVGISLPHHAASQYRLGRAVSRDSLAPGDLVFFNGLGHVGIYIGGGRFVHSPHTGDVVKISSLSDSWYASTWVGARRL
jgi:cell wall-associated NlpC family hydrolase/exonuclease VII small subunit